MRLLPDRNFKENYKKRYDANYTRIMTFRNARAELKAGKRPVTGKQVGTGFVGFVATIVVLGTLAYVGFFMSSWHDAKKAEIKALNDGIQSLNMTIQEYQTINADEKYEQIEEAVVVVTDLQNQYVANTFSDSFSTYAVRYLGSHNENWAADISGLVRPVWKGHIDRAGDFRSSVDMIFILYNEAKPAVVVKTMFEIDAAGNLGEMTGFEKMVLI